ncbi:MAG: DUF342 domain-containing protein [Desulfamplus sp.]|nr:DUF342 domain-containing protein [Desulfamplus sp.]
MEKRKTILIVDDQASIIKSLKRLLLQEDYAILSAPNGPAALELIANRGEQDDIFLIISDQRMPNMTGLEFLEHSVELLPNAIRFILSGYSDNEIALNGIKKGTVHRYLTKPWRNDELLLIIHQAYESPEKVRRLADSIVNADDGVASSSEPNIMEKEIKEFDQRAKDRALGKMALHHGFINQEQLNEAMATMQIDRQSGRNVSLENILLEKAFISSDNIGKLVAATRRRVGKSFGSIAIKDYGVAPKEIERCLAIQSKEFADTSTCRLLGDILVFEKLLTEDQKDSILIDMTYSEREIFTSSNEKNSQEGALDQNQSNGNGDTPTNETDKKILLNKKKRKFFKQRALDKIICKSAIEMNLATEPEVLKALEEQLLHFMKMGEIKAIRDVFIDHSINLPTDEDKIKDAAAITQDTNSKIIKFGNNNCFEVAINNDATEATIKIVAELPEGMNVDKLKELLATNSITYGIADDVAIELFLRGWSSKAKTNQEVFTIAKGKAAKEGRNAGVKYFFEDHNADFGKELESGKFDYRERGEMSTVEEGAILAEKIPPIPALNGISIYGLEIVAPLPVDINLDCGKGAMLSEDGLKVIASANGRPDVSLGGKISVFPEIVVKGDVDFKTGNIKFNGDVTVHGTILAGFSVVANNLTVSDIEEADVNIANMLIVKNSINDATVKTGGNIAAQIIKNSTITARGDVVVQKEIIDSTIITSGKVIVPRGRIVATTIHAAKGVEAMNIGSEVASPCHIFPGADDHSLDTVNRFNDKINIQKEGLTKLEELKAQCEEQNWTQLNNLSEASKVQEQLSDERQEILNKLSVYQKRGVKRELEESLSELDKKIVEAEKSINTLFDENETMQSKIKQIEAKIEGIKKNIQVLLNDKSKFEKWYKDQKEQARKEGIGVAAQGTIFARTVVATQESSITLKNHIKNSKVHQILNNEDPNNPFYEMRIDPVASKSKQPHVYRN